MCVFGDCFKIVFARVDLFLSDCYLSGDWIELLEGELVLYDVWFVK